MPDLPNNGGDNSWRSWFRWVKSGIIHNETKIEKLENRVKDLETNQTILKLKSGIWGAIGAMIPIISAILLGLIWHLLKN
jgi:hypothetical protein